MKLDITNKDEKATIRVRQDGKPDTNIAPGETVEFDADSPSNLLFDEVEGEGTGESDAGEGSEGEDSKSAA